MSERRPLTRQILVTPLVRVNAKTLIIWLLLASNVRMLNLCRGKTSTKNESTDENFMFNELINYHVCRNRRITRRIVC